MGTVTGGLVLLQNNGVRHPTQCHDRRADLQSGSPATHVSVYPCRPLQVSIESSSVTNLLNKW